MPYHIDYLPTARKAIEKLPRQIQRRVLERIGTLASNPRPTGSVKLKGEPAYRLRIGDYRVIYTIEDQKLVVLIVDLGHRREVYRK